MVLRWSLVTLPDDVAGAELAAAEAELVIVTGALEGMDVTLLSSGAAVGEAEAVEVGVLDVDKDEEVDVEDAEVDEEEEVEVEVEEDVVEVEVDEDEDDPPSKSVKIGERRPPLDVDAVFVGAWAEFVAAVLLAAALACELVCGAAELAALSEVEGVGSAPAFATAAFFPAPAGMLLSSPPCGLRFFIMRWRTAGA